MSTATILPASWMRQVATEEYWRAVEKAALQNIEVSLCWYTL